MLETSGEGSSFNADVQLASSVSLCIGSSLLQLRQFAVVSQRNIMTYFWAALQLHALSLICVWVYLCLPDPSTQKVHQLHVSQVRLLWRLTNIDVINALQRNKVSKAWVAGSLWHHLHTYDIKDLDIRNAWGMPSSLEDLGVTSYSKHASHVSLQAFV